MVQAPDPAAGPMVQAPDPATLAQHCQQLQKVRETTLPTVTTEATREAQLAQAQGTHSAQPATAQGTHSTQHTKSRQNHSEFSKHLWNRSIHILLSSRTLAQHSYAKPTIASQSPSHTASAAPTQCTSITFMTQCRIQTRRASSMQCRRRSQASPTLLQKHRLKVQGW